MKKSFVLVFYIVTLALAAAGEDGRPQRWTAELDYLLNYSTDHRTHPLRPS